MNKEFMRKNGAGLFAVSALLLLPSCGLVDWVKEKFSGSSSSGSSMSVATTSSASDADSGPVVATIDGKPLITKGMLDSEKKKLLDANPQLQAMIAMMDEKQLDRNLADGMMSREVIRKYVADHNVENSDKYKKDFETVLSQVRDALNTRYFMDALEVKVTENEVKSFYDQNKDMIPNLLVSKGGIESVAVAFKDKAQADDFAAKVRNNKNDLNRVAKEAGLASKVKDLKLVNDQSIGLEPELRDQIVQVKAVPSVNTFKAGNEYWVVAASKKENPQYRALDQVKDELRQMLEKDKTMKRFEEEVARLRNEYRIELNEGFFAGNVDNAQAVQAAAQAQEEAVETAQNEAVHDVEVQAPTQAA